MIFCRIGSERRIRRPGGTPSDDWSAYGFGETVLPDHWRELAAQLRREGWRGDVPALTDLLELDFPVEPALSRSFEIRGDLERLGSVRLDEGAGVAVERLSRFFGWAVDCGREAKGDPVWNIHVRIQWLRRDSHRPGPGPTRDGA
ncbi:hypothetical protein [Tautonia plasticadhaerens]|uniref:hypothetical protein n=1 Tax=Tautonia plasticadhaerens TaxID=2527974 RepID=UPI0011A05A26|nr:hypothetical protein [Tautonia plasticadhaerens]